MRPWTRLFWIGLAAFFLFEAWVWDLCVAAGRWIAERLPLEPLRCVLRRAIERLPAPVVLLVFLIPLAILEPLKFAALWLIATHHWFWGLALFVVAKFVGLGVIAFLFDLTREKLLSMEWMARLYRLTMRALSWAHVLVDPYRRAVREQMSRLRARIAQLVESNAGRTNLLGKVLRLRARLRRQA